MEEKEVQLDRKEDESCEVLIVHLFLFFFLKLWMRAQTTEMW